MDANASYPLVVLPPEQGSLVPVSATLVVDVAEAPADAEPDFHAFAAFLWRHFCKLAFLFFLARALVRRLRRQAIELRLQANYWRAQHQRAVQREAELKEQVRQLQGEIRAWKRRLFARTSEKSTTAKTPSNAKATRPGHHGTPRQRGQQPGSPGHGRRQHDHLETRHEDRVLPDAEQRCACCGAPLVEIPGSADGDILAIDVRAYRRR